MHKSLIGLCFVALLAGCSGNTYGTGVSSEKQLIDDLGNVVTLDLRKKKNNIKYNSRPKLVTPPVVAQLPTPAENVQAESAYFPEDPEVKRKRLLAELAESDSVGDEVSPELQRLRQESLARSKSRKDYFAVKYPNLPRNSDGECDMCEYYERTDQDKQRKGEKVAAATQPKVYKRRYLTEPPTEYQAPAETAEVGVMGEEELSEAALARLKLKQNEKSIWKKIFGG